MSDTADTELSAIQALSSALGDPTRREIYIYVRANGPVTAQEIGRQFHLHPNVARHHLDRLAAGGYLVVGQHKDPRPQVGRPSKQYEAAGTPLLAEGVLTQGELLARLLDKALAMIEPATAERLAYEVGHGYGAELGRRMNGDDATRSIRASLQLVADALTRNGFSSRRSGEELALENRACPFGELVAQHPVLCATERGIIEGLLSSVAIDGSDARVEPRRGDVCEVTIHPVAIRSAR
jgi:predicted ArsR family transcriptional regulator